MQFYTPVRLVLICQCGGLGAALRSLPSAMKASNVGSRPSNDGIIELAQLREFYDKFGSESGEARFLTFTGMLQKLGAEAVTHTNDYGLSNSRWRFGVKLPQFESEVTFLLTEGYHRTGVTGKVEVSLDQIGNVVPISISGIDLKTSESIGAYSVKTIASRAGDASGCSPEEYTSELCKRVKSASLMSMTNLAHLTSLIAFSIGANQINYNDAAGAPAWCDTQVDSSLPQVTLLPLRLLANKSSIYQSVAPHGFFDRNAHLDERRKEILRLLVDWNPLRWEKDGLNLTFGEMAREFIEDTGKARRGIAVDALLDKWKERRVMSCADLVETLNFMATTTTRALKKHVGAYNFGWKRHQDDMAANFEMLENLPFNECNASLSC